MIKGFVTVSHMHLNVLLNHIEDGELVIHGDVNARYPPREVTMNVYDEKVRRVLSGVLSGIIALPSVTLTKLFDGERYRSIATGKVITDVIQNSAQVLHGVGLLASIYDMLNPEHGLMVDLETRQVMHGYTRSPAQRENPLIVSASLLRSDKNGHAKYPTETSMLSQDTQSRLYDVRMQFYYVDIGVSTVEPSSGVSEEIIQFLNSSF